MAQKKKAKTGAKSKTEKKPAEAIAKQRYKQIIAPTGEWFQIQVESYKDERWLMMSRIIAWAIVEDPHPRIEDCVQGISTLGYGHIEDRLEYYYVYGDDKAPNGKTWREIFRETDGEGWTTKEITALFPEGPHGK